MSFLEPSSSSSSDQLLAFAWATLGGLAVAAGLVLEKFSDELNDRFVGGFKPHKWIGELGWWILMIGIVIETGVAGVSAIAEWQTRQMTIKNDPRRQPIVSVIAHAIVIVRSAKQNEFVTDNGGIFAPPDAGMKIVDPGAYDSVRIAGLRVGNKSNFRTNQWKGLFFAPDGRINSARPAGNEMTRFDLSFDKLNELIRNRNFLTSGALDMVIIEAPFLWTGYLQRFEVVTGNIEMTINSSIKIDFAIPAQTNFSGLATSVKTNGVFIPLIFR